VVAPDATGPVLATPMKAGTPVSIAGVCEG
jgi:hypothetical protein